MPRERIKTTVCNLSVAVRELRWLPNQTNVELTADRGSLKIDWEHENRRGSAIVTHGQLTYVGKGW